MALNASKVKSQSAPKNFTPLEAGNYLARLVQVIDLGMQKQRPYQGQEKPLHIIHVFYDFGNEYDVVHCATRSRRFVRIEIRTGARLCQFRQCAFVHIESVENVAHRLQFDVQVV